MRAYPVQVDEAIWMVPLNLPPPPAVFWAPQADRTNASIVTRGRSDRFANMESPPRADSAPRTNSGLGGACAEAEHHMYATDGRDHRVRRPRESLDAMISLWTNERTTLEGR